MKFKHEILVFFSGLLWLFIGTYLLILGLNLSLEAINSPIIANYPIHNAFASLLGGKTFVGVILISLGLMIGFFKGQYVLSKSARRVVKRIVSFANPMSIIHIYSPSYYILLGSMVFLGISIKYFNCPSDIRGFVDIAIGAALITGSLFFFKLASMIRNNHSFLTHL